MLSRTQQELSNQFARSGTDKWAGVRWTHTPLHDPAIDGCLTWLDCTIDDEIVVGDHP